MPRTAGAAMGGNRRLCVYNAGFYRSDRLRPIMAAAGYDVSVGIPRNGDAVGVWGRSPYAWRGEAMAARFHAPLIRVEDAFLRSVHSGRAGKSGPLGVFIDPYGVHFDSGQPSLIEHILMNDPLGDVQILQRAADGIARLKALDISKYNNFDPDLPAPDAGYVLVIDQTVGDASVRFGGATADTFRQMLERAKADHPDARILLRVHPETRDGLRRGHFSSADTDGRVTLYDAPVSPWKLLRNARAVYAVSSLMGYEAILAGHRPVVFGQPFYAGWGRSHDIHPVSRRTRHLSVEQMFTASHILAPTWYDPCRRRLCTFEEAVDQLAAEVRAWREDRFGYVASGMRLWKRGPLQRFFGRNAGVRFVDPPAKAAQVAQSDRRTLLIWAGKEPMGFTETARRIEDGFLRSRGLGADLIPPLSLVSDGQGIYYDPTRPSDMENAIAAPMLAGGADRIARLLATITTSGVSKYNLGGAMPDLPAGHRILVPGQVEDDASIRLGGGDICTNLGLLARVRAKNPDAVLLFKPHPDVEAGLRPGRVDDTDALRYADAIVAKSDAMWLLSQVKEVWTMTSLLGFEALLRGVAVTVTGAPFYAGWGLTRDLGDIPARRVARPDLAGLAYAALITYPRYFDPVSGLPCPPEVVVERLATGTIPRPSSVNRMISKAQGVLANYAYLWR